MDGVITNIYFGLIFGAWKLEVATRTGYDDPIKH